MHITMHGTPRNTLASILNCARAGRLALIRFRFSFASGRKKGKNPHISQRISLQPIIEPTAKSQHPPTLYPPPSSFPQENIHCGGRQDSPSPPRSRARDVGRGGTSQGPSRWIRVSSGRGLGLRRGAHLETQGSPFLFFLLSAFFTPE